MRLSKGLSIKNVKNIKKDIQKLLDVEIDSIPLCYKIEDYTGAKSMLYHILVSTHSELFKMLPQFKI